MAVEVAITGNGMYAGAKSAIESYSVSEESTPTEASDSSGAVGQIKFSAIEDPTRFGSHLLLSDTLELTDGDRGMTRGTIASVNSNDGKLDVTADSLLGRLVVDKKAAPVHDYFPAVMRYYLSLAGIDNAAIDASFNSILIHARAWEGDLWTKVKELCVTYGAEITLLRGDVAVRPVRQRSALQFNNFSESWTVSNRDTAKAVEVYYYNSRWKVDSVIYPKNGWDEEMPIYSLNAGTALTVNIPIDVSVESITQPSYTSSVARDYMGPNSVYAVVGSEGDVLPGGFWANNGGKVTAEIGEDGKSIDLTVVAPDVGTVAARYSPFRLASKDSRTGEFYSSIRIIGTGVHFDQQSIIVPTGADDTYTSRDVGVTVDNYFISSEGQARSLALDVCSRWASPQRTLRISKAAVNKPEDTKNDYDFATFAQFDAYAASNSITTFADFDTAWSGQKFRDFDAYWYDIVKDDFRYQVFGNAAGSRIAWRRAIYRIRSVDITPDEISYTADEDTTVGDFDSSAVGMTIADFDASYAGLKFSDFALIPLPNVLPQLERW